MSIAYNAHGLGEIAVHHPIPPYQRVQNVISVTEYLRDVAIRCDRLARKCTHERSKHGLQGLSLELAEKAQELEQFLWNGRAPEIRRKLLSSSCERCLGIITVSTVLLTALNLSLDLPHLVFAYLVPVTLIAIWYGCQIAFVGLIASVLYAAFIFYPPKFTMYFADPQQLLELLFFSGVSFLIIRIVEVYATNRQAKTPGHEDEAVSL